MTTVKDVQAKLPKYWTDSYPDIAAPDLTELLAAADECAGVAETGVERKYWATLWGRDDPGYKRDMAPVRRLRAAVARVRGE